MAKYILFILSVSVLVLIGSLSEGTCETIVVPYDFASIQEAFSAAGQGDVVLIENGIYSGDIDVTKQLVVYASGNSGLDLIPARSSNDSDLEIYNGVSLTDNTFQIPVKVNSAPNDVVAFGLDVAFDHSSLTYTGYTAGELAEDFSYFDANNFDEGKLRIGGFTTGQGILEGESGTLVTLDFEVASCVVGENSPLGVDNLKDQFVGWNIADGTFYCCCQGAIEIQGDVNVGAGTWIIHAEDTLAVSGGMSIETGLLENSGLLVLD